MTRRIAACGLLALVACTSAPAVVPPPPEPVETSEITAEELRRDLTAFAHDSMRGRETGTDDATRAASFLAERVRRLGLEPAGDSLYLQRVPLQRESFSEASRIEVQEGGRTTPLTIGEDVVPVINLGPGVPPTKRRAEGGLVFIGYGMVAAKPKRDDFAGLDLEGKVVVVVNGAPAGLDSATRVAMEAETAISDRLAQILPRRPAAVVVLLTGGGDALFRQLVPALVKGVSARSSGGDIPDEERPLPMIVFGAARAGSPLLPARWPTDDRAQVLAGRRFSARVEQLRTPFTAFNVVAVIRGSNRALSNTYVALGAHSDHIGIVPPVRGDSIANGADDDGSGSVSLLAIARSIQRQSVRPKRSMLFVWHTGEEKGLLGSSWFTDHPTVPIDSIVAQLNADMIGRNADPLLYTVGPRSAPNNLSVRLGAIVDSVNATQAPPFVINRDFDSATHPEHIFERSDHFSYARKGIPIVFFTTGMHADYHAASDDVAKIDFDKMARVARLMRDVATVVGNQVKRPR